MGVRTWSILNPYSFATSIAAPERKAIIAWNTCKVNIVDKSRFQ